ncbi:MAG: putative Shikimate 5-dehydrogenase [Planctomycetota bacterium]|jgi:hypothetical protein
MRVMIIGSGKRVRETALPAFLRAGESYEIAAVCARTAKELVVDGRQFGVRPFEGVTAQDLGGVDLVYVAVGKAATPEVLKRLVSLQAARVDLLIDTPVLVFKHFRHTPLLARFRNVWVAEDCAFLPWIPLVHGAVESGIIGALRSATFDRSAYAYHAHATLKALVPGCSLLSARRVQRSAQESERRFQFTRQWRARVVDPRDYSCGRFRIEGEHGSLADAGEGLRIGLEGIERLRAGDLVHPLDEREQALLGESSRGRSLTAAQEAMKRVGFLRLLRSIASGRGGYSLRDGLDDMVSDYWLEKTGRWWATPLTSVDSGLARGIYRGISRIGGR